MESRYLSVAEPDQKDGASRITSSEITDAAITMDDYLLILFLPGGSVGLCRYRNG